MLYPLLFESNLIPLVWGGHRLKHLKGLPADKEPIGESWEVSTFHGRESIVSNGLHAGKKLTELTQQYGPLLLGKSIYERFGDDFPILVKILDVDGKLSVQVHPDNKLAMLRHGCFGKTEMWYVVDADPGSYVYAGFNEDITVEEYRQRAKDGTISDVLAKHPISRGDAFFIPAGRIHAICGKALMIEVQQHSDITYRIYDHGRLGLDGKPRKLHTEEAISALDFIVHKEYSINYPNVMNQANPVCECEFFTVRLLRFNQTQNRNLFHQDSFVIYVCFQGECKIGESLLLKQGQSCLVPASCADIVIAPSIDNCETELLEIFINHELNDKSQERIGANSFFCPH